MKSAPRRVPPWRGWAAVSPTGLIVVGTISHTKAETRERAGWFAGKHWVHLERDYWTTEKIIISQDNRKK